MIHIASPITTRRWWIALLPLLGVNLALVAASVITYPTLLTQTNSWQYIAEPIVLLLGYAAIILSIGWYLTPSSYRAVEIGTGFGVITAILWIINLGLETFADGSALFTTAPFLLGGFGLWGIAGFVGAQRLRSFRLGILTAVWSAMICVLGTVTFGLLLHFVALARLEQLLSADPDYLRSGWTDLHAFVIANQFDSAFSHLLGALIIGCLIGTAGSGLARLWTTAKRKSPGEP